MVILLIIILPIALKAIWVACATSGHGAFDKERDGAHGGGDHQQDVIVHRLQGGERRHPEKAHRAENHHHHGGAQGDPGAVLLKAQHEHIGQDKHDQGRNQDNPSKYRYDLRMSKKKTLTAGTASHGKSLAVYRADRGLRPREWRSARRRTGAGYSLIREVS